MQRQKYTKSPSQTLLIVFKTKKSNQIFLILAVGYYAEECNEWRDPSPRLSAWATQLRRYVAAVASRWRHCADLTDPGFELQSSRIDSLCAKQLS